MDSIMATFGLQRSRVERISTIGPRPTEPACFIQGTITLDGATEAAPLGVVTGADVMLRLTAPPGKARPRQRPGSCQKARLYPRGCGTAQWPKVTRYLPYATLSVDAGSATWDKRPVIRWQWYL